ncbi:agmatinase [candidate division WOR-3 bacterium]|nr:agmatinase [candidate division WOR-3 bacterium]
MKFYFAASERNTATVTVVGMPLDRTSSWVSGTRFGPYAARVGADNIESFSPWLRRDIADVRVHDAGDLSFTFATPSDPLDEIRNVTSANLDLGIRQLAIGGEHTITPAIVEVLADRHPDLCVVQFDAHSDLRDDYLGERWAHATAIRRVLDFVPRDRVFQLGIRSFSDGSEMDETGVYPFEVVGPAAKVAGLVGRRPVYLTLDLDVLDPGVLPDVQTPQPGGCSYRELVDALVAFRNSNLVGMDIVEFCPRGPHPTPGSALVAELVRESVLLLAG